MTAGEVTGNWSMWEISGGQEDRECGRDQHKPPTPYTDGRHWADIYSQASSSGSGRRKLFRIFQWNYREILIIDYISPTRFCSLFDKLGTKYRLKQIDALFQHRLRTLTQCLRIALKRLYFQSQLQFLISLLLHKVWTMFWVWEIIMMFQVYKITKI